MSVRQRSDRGKNRRKGPGRMIIDKCYRWHVFISGSRFGDLTVPSRETAFLLSLYLIPICQMVGKELYRKFLLWKFHAITIRAGELIQLAIHFNDKRKFTALRTADFAVFDPADDLLPIVNSHAIKYTRNKEKGTDTNLSFYFFHLSRKGCSWNNKYNCGTIIDSNIIRFLYDKL